MNAFLHYFTLGGGGMSVGKGGATNLKLGDQCIER